MMHLFFAALLSLTSMADSLQDETTRLESALARGKMSEEKRIRLAEIYFLTSRCDDLKRIHPPVRTSLLCVCGGECGRGSAAQRAAVLRKLYSKSAQWTDTEVQRAWRFGADIPEARYWALKILQATRRAFVDPKLVAIRQELEKSLAALEVNP